MKLVIDADIIRSAGYSEHPTSSASRELLEMMKVNTKYSAPCCPLLLAEWRKHRSMYSRLWISHMIARKRIIFSKGEVDEARVFISNLDDSTDEKLSLKNITLKDAHLLDLAIEHDKIIFSNDTKAKTAFSTVLDNRSSFKNICWLNPIMHLSLIKEDMLNKQRIQNYTLV